MATGERRDLEALSERWSEALARDNFDDALRAATEGYFAARESGDRISVVMFLGFVRRAASTLFERFSANSELRPAPSNVCSFCLKEKANLVRGVDARICSDCIGLAKSATE
jgi:uncharacterized protein (DUF58 family)